MAGDSANAFCSGSYTWQKITVALAVAGRIDGAITALPRAVDWGTTNAAFAALAHASRSEETKNSRR
jgi:hypothetical protein